ncbi:MAG: hypothetical protein V1755_06910 [Chloroflexota bacterium]
MKSKAEIIREHLAGLRVLDIGGSGYEQNNAYERELAEAWSLCKARVSVDCSPNADISADLNSLPLPALTDTYDIATAFDVLEHLEHPVAVLKWIPTDRLIVTLPNALSWIARRMEERNGSKHLYSFTPYTASVLLAEGGWGVTRIEYQFGKWSLLAKTINIMGSLMPSRVGTGMLFHCDRNEPTKK